MEVTDIVLPDVDTVLDNGLRVVVVRTPVVPLVELRLVVPCGRTVPRDAARSELLAACLLHHHEAERIDRELAAVGGELRAGTDARRLILSGFALGGDARDGLPVLLDVLAEALLGFGCPPGALAHERAALAERLRVAWSHPAAVARAALQRHRFGDDFAALEIPDPAQLPAVGFEDLRALHASAVRPAGSVLVLTGDLDPDRALALVEAALKCWPRGRGFARTPGPPPVRGGRLRPYDRPGAVQSHIRLSARALPRTDPAFPALQLADLAFGGYFASRLVDNLRERNGYAYTARSGIDSAPGSGTLVVEADTSTASTAAALAAIRGELHRFVRQPPSAAEIDAARRYAIGSTTTAMASPGSLAMAVANLVEVGVGPAWLHEQAERLGSVTMRHVMAVARKFYDFRAFTGVVVADGASATVAGLVAGDDGDDQGDGDGDDDNGGHGGPSFG
ncbi:pitrilysin family protein [Streptomyces sp. NBC_00847]|uniref:M16 family metallopeptidase n=1 Tax=Streptomyces sp. NBC_00847 TaxID=2975850 RepID=UPI002253652B|nr:insulinase family protein [Streptomyces sp. NBC_00847]MCX4882365.1 insulinase family protein [Streptomyces sp. NBC_00847]